ncbi:MAG: acyl-CoA dehydrogenase family protein [Chloroflexi bacterium]|nr:acyl-CoA dehydrogenase family protein [Chloroflexota bacterium]
MDFELSDEQRMIQRTLREFTDEVIVPQARENDRQERFPRETIQQLGQQGWTGAPVPPEYGGMGLDFISEAILFEEIGRGDSSIRTTLSVQISLVELTILRWGNEEQKRTYLPRLARAEIIGCFGLTEPGAGSDPAGLRTFARRANDRWVLNGSKTWISNGGIADLAIIFAQTDPAQKHREMAAFLVERGMPGYSTQDIKGKLGLRASNTAELILENVEVPKENLLSKVGDGFAIAMSALDNGRYGVAAGCVGIGQACIEASLKYAKERHQFGRPIASFQLVQEMIADMIVETEAARLLVYRAGHVKNLGKKSTLETTIAKLYASEAALRAADRAIQIHGGYGYSDEYPVERYWRDARVATIYEGTSQIQKLIIGRESTGIDAFA